MSLRTQGPPLDSATRLRLLTRERDDRLAQIDAMQARIDAGLGPEPGGDPAPPEEILEWAVDQLRDVDRWIEFTVHETSTKE